MCDVLVCVCVWVPSAIITLSLSLLYTIAELRVQYAWLLLYSPHPYFCSPQHLNISQNFQQQQQFEQRSKKIVMKFNEEKWGKIKRTHLSHVDEQSNMKQERATVCICALLLTLFLCFAHSLCSPFPLSCLINVHQSKSSRITFISKLIYKCLFYPSVFMMMMVMMQRDKFAHLHTFHKSFDEWYRNRFAHL